MIRARVLGGKWAGSREGEVDDEFYDVDEEFRPIARPNMHGVLSKDTSIDPIVMPPHPDAPGHEYLDASLRDMTGVLHSRLHLMTHESLTNERSPCWLCVKAASQQKRKSQAKFRNKQLEHPTERTGSLVIKVQATMLLSPILWQEAGS